MDKHLEELINKLKNIKIQNLIYGLFLGVAILLYGMSLFTKDRAPKTYQPSLSKQTEAQQAASILNKKAKGSDFEEQLEKRLEEALCQIENAGEVKVMATLDSMEEDILATEENNQKSTTKETDGNKGTRDVQQQSEQTKIVMGNSGDGVTEPYVVKKLQPRVLGVLVLADGGDQPKVQTEISQAVSTILGLPVSKVVVMKKINK